MWHTYWRAGPHFTTICPVTCDACGQNVCDFSTATCYDNEDMFQQQSSFAKSDIGKYKTCREAADYEPYFCALLEEASKADIIPSPLVTIALSYHWSWLPPPLVTVALGSRRP